jgi:hypothetical protein
MGTRRLLFLLSSLLFGSCFQQSGNNTSQILPPDYQTSAQVARTCRLNVGHASKYMVVYTNAVADAAYLAGTSPLPQASTVVAVESDKTDCSTLTGYTLMRKEAPGYNPAAGDWHWQRLDDQRDVLEDGRLQTCISCHTTCSLNDYTCSPP